MPLFRETEHSTVRSPEEQLKAALTNSIKDDIDHFPIWSHGKEQLPQAILERGTAIYHKKKKLLLTDPDGLLHINLYKLLLEQNPILRKIDAQQIHWGEKPYLSIMYLVLRSLPLVKIGFLYVEDVSSQDCQFLRSQGYVLIEPMDKKYLINKGIRGVVKTPSPFTR